MNNLLLLFPPSLSLSTTCVAHFTAAGYRVRAFETPDTLSAAGGILLASPVYLPEHDAFVASDAVWQRFLALQNPDVRLIRIGLNPTDATTNTLHWLRPPADFAAFLAQCQPASAGRLPELGPSQTIDEVWKGFFEGHNRSGFRYYLIDLANHMRVFAHKLSEGGVEAFESEKRDLLTFEMPSLVTQTLRQWRNYRVYWQTTPLHDAIGYIDRLLGIVDTDLEKTDDFDEFFRDVLAINLNLNEVQTSLYTLNPYFQPAKPYGK